jgi:plasmid stabilization system protein ParE
MTFQVVISTQAAAELRAVAEWWAEHRDAEQAARWFLEFDAQLRGLGVNPYRYAVADENAGFPYELRALHFGVSSRPTHRALFTVVEPDVVVVLTIRHVAQDRVTPEDVNPPSGST